VTVSPVTGECTVKKVGITLQCFILLYLHVVYNSYQDRIVESTNNFNK